MFGSALAFFGDIVDGVSVWQLLWISLISILSSLILLKLLVYYLKTKEEGLTEQNAWDRLITTILVFCLDLLLWPYTIFKALCYSLEQDGTGRKRANFSLTRTIFALSSLIMLFRLAVGGVTLHNARVGPNIEDTQKKVSHLKTMAQNKYLGNKTKSRRRRRTIKNSSSPSSVQKSQVPQEKKEVRPWFYIQNLSYQPVQWYELLLYMIIVMLYYFRRNLREGDQNGIFSQLLEVLGRAYAIKLSGQPSPMTTTVEITPPPGGNTVGIVPPSTPNETPSSAPPPIPETKGTSEGGSRRKPRRKRGEISSESQDPFLNR